MSESRTPLSDPAGDDEHRPWSRRRQEIGAIVWSSFLAACVATMFFFAIFDPVLLASDDDPPAWLASRMSGYALGFFFFWLTTFASALLTAYLLDSLPNNKESDASSRRGL